MLQPEGSEYPIWATQRDALGGQLLSLAQHLHAPALLLEAHRALWQSLFWFGEFPLARIHLEEGMTL